MLIGVGGVLVREYLPTAATGGAARSLGVAGHHVHTGVADTLRRIDGFLAVCGRGEGT